MIVLLVNDHFLKQVWPGLVTGKLSDVAGMVVVPPLLALVPLLLCGGHARGRRHADRVALAAIVVVGAGFALVKTTTTGAALASRAWSVLWGPSLVRADASDLLALPALGVAWWIWRLARHAAATNPGAVRTARFLVVVPLALFAVVATPAPPQYPQAEAVDVQDGVIVVRSRSDLLISRDGGASWKTAAEVPPGETAPGGRQKADHPAADVSDDRTSPHRFLWPGTHREACVLGEPRRCYRVDPPALQVSETTDGGLSWSTAWSVPPETRQRLFELCDGDDDFLYSTALAVAPRPGGHVVVVANGCDGVVVRDTTGAWHRWTFHSDGVSPSPGDRRPLRERPFPVADENADSPGGLPLPTPVLVAVGLLLAALVTVTAIALAIDRRRAASRRRDE
ncbi:hypothetical protein [Sphaerisporangium corydalis]|uniref:Exo-alpha-sialidase n=1 Tax=Sphaerisporangium corydalis TaxID=1441875 RepID=A0ABV9E8Y6_9ACTN|nr:hypothetical protein [Sphaerisporangium corydalis]